MNKYSGVYGGLKVVVLDDSYFLTGYQKTTTPRRKHHKRRIQKKWIKRYGYVYVPIYDFTKSWIWNGTLLISRVRFEMLKEICEQQDDIWTNFNIERIKE